MILDKEQECEPEHERELDRELGRVYRRTIERQDSFLVLFEKKFDIGTGKRKNDFV